MCMRNSIRIVFFLLIVCCLTACYSNKRHASGQMPAMDYTDTQIDSLRFLMTHHYTENFNFVVRSDSLTLTRQMPEELLNGLAVDSFSVGHEQRLVVADIRIMPNDTEDSVWIQVAVDQANFGWVHESELLQNVDPDDPISQFISFFSNEHLLIFLIVVILIFVGYTVRLLIKHNAHIVHFRDIDTFYPTLLALIVAISATLYSSIQLFAPDMWRHFYFHPTLNPFTQPWILAVFLASVWLMVIVAIAAIDDTFRHLSVGEGLLYLLGLLGMCALNYVVFSVSTLYYIGYPLLVLYVTFAFWRYIRHTRSKYICGNCGMQIHQKGQCPHCGTINI